MGTTKILKDVAQKLLIKQIIHFARKAYKCNNLFDFQYMNVFVHVFLDSSWRNAQI